MKAKVQSFGRFLSGMVMPNIGAFIAWGLLTALFIDTGWLPVPALASIVSPMLSYLLPILIAYQGGKMVGGNRGAVMGAIAAIGVIVGAPDYPMFMGAMIAGPIGGLVIKLFDKLVDGHVPAGFEMLVDNFSIGILGLGLIVGGYYGIGPLMEKILVALSAGVQVLVDHSLLPLVSIIVEPAKVLFLNNAINHGIFTPLGGAEAQELGKSIFYMIETNPGPGTGVLLAYWMFSKDKTTKDSAPGAIIIHFFGGIHEISFPYILMNPLLILATIGGSVAAMFFNMIFKLGLVGPPAPGSIIAYLAMAPKGSTFMVILSVVIAAVVSFLIASPIIKFSDGGKSLEESEAEMKKMKAESKGVSVDQVKTVADSLVSVSAADIKHIVFACDAGMGSSAMGATVLKKKLAEVGRKDIEVGHASVSEIPEGTQIVVCHKDLSARAEKSAPNARIVTITNFMAAPEYDQLAQELKI